MVTSISVVSEENVVIGKLALRDPAGTVTLAGTLATAGCVLERATTVPPAGANWFNVTTPVAGVPPVTLPGRTTKSVGAGAPGGTTATVPVPPTPLIVATRLIPKTSETVDVVIGNDAESAPAGMFTRSGTVMGT